MTEVEINLKPKQDLNILSSIFKLKIRLDLSLILVILKD